VELKKEIATVLGADSKSQTDRQKDRQAETFDLYVKGT